MVGFFNSTGCPSGWLAANGASRTPDLRGRFVRGVRGNSSALGTVQGDAIRNITGSIESGHMPWHLLFESRVTASGAFSLELAPAYNAEDFYGDENAARRPGFDASRVVPTANVKNRPINVAFFACIKNWLML